MRHPFGFALQDALAHLRDPEGPISPPGIPPANPLGLPPHSALAQQQAPAEAMPQPMPTDAQKPRMGRGELIMGILADALAGAQGRPGMFAQQIGQRRQQESEQALEMAKWHRQRQAGREDKQWEWDNKPREAPAPDPIERLMRLANIDPSSPQGRDYARQALEGRVDPARPTLVQTPTGPQLIYTRQSQIGGGYQSPPEIIPELPAGAVPIPGSGGAGPAAAPATFPRWR